MRNTNTPKKLKQDAIIEALLEVRFEMPETFPEIFLGRMVEYEPWKGFSPHRLPNSEFPPSLRQVDPNLQFLPIFQLLDAENNRSVRIGERVLSYHQLKPYVGWGKFNDELNIAIEGLFDKVENLVITRLGFRYLNALSKDLHGISSASDLDINIEISGEKILDKVNINFTKSLPNQMNCTVRIATPEFIQGSLPPNTSVFIDIDIFTEDNFKASNKQTVKNWIRDAHDVEKNEFFKLLKDETINDLREE